MRGEILMDKSHNGIIVIVEKIASLPELGRGKPRPSKDFAVFSGSWH
jgi:hypothetical protein